MPVLHDKISGGAPRVLTRLLAGLALLTLAGIPATAADVMTAKQLAATIPGKTLVTKHRTSGKTLVLVYSGGSNKGTFGGTYDGKPNKGTWWIKGNKWCEDWGRGNGCWRAVQIDAKTLQFFRDDGSLEYQLKIQ
ncbi:hypothetical protein ACRARG_09635 [Pseudooceanicola sp. C21-150M6]|uniref:hypothetical protein n=1 Tax=Pseudooceanicola sp. C21-150M6 TaxID=3434355 RepID=UPI003D7F1BF3